jgi:hypothetical protein
MADDVASIIRQVLAEGGLEPVPAAGARGRAMQVDPIKHTLKAPGSMHLKLGYGGPVSNFGFEFNLRRYSELSRLLEYRSMRREGRGLHSSTYQLNLSRL